MNKIEIITLSLTVLLAISEALGVTKKFKSSSILQIIGKICKALLGLIKKPKK